MATLAVLALAAALVSVCVGYAQLDIVAAFADALAGRDTVGALVLEQLRLPRAALGAMVGFSLGLAGAALQGLLRNPLADPGVIGVSGGAALGAVDRLLFRPRRRLRAGAAARRRRRRDPRGAGALCARRPRRRRDDADPRRGDDQRLRRRADLAGAQPVAQPLRRLRNHVLADGLARRPQPAAIVAGAAADRWSAGRCC